MKRTTRVMGWFETSDARLSATATVMAGRVGTYRYRD